MNTRKKKPSNSIAKEESQHHAIFVKPPPLPTEKNSKNMEGKKHRTIVSVRIKYAPMPRTEHSGFSLSIILLKTNKTKHMLTKRTSPIVITHFQMSTSINEDDTCFIKIGSC